MDIQGAIVYRCYRGHARIESSPQPSTRRRRWRLPALRITLPAIQIGWLALMLMVLVPKRTGSRHDEFRAWCEKFPPIRGGAAITASAAGGNWNASGAWVGGTPPGSGDDVALASTSGNISVNVASACRNFDATGYTNTLAFSGLSLTINPTAAGTVTFVAGMTITGVATIAIVSATGTNSTLTTGGKTLPGVNFNSSTTGGVTLADGLTISGTFTHTQGNVNTNGQTCNWGAYSNTGTATRSLTMGASAITLPGTSVQATWTLTSATGMTITANTATVTESGASASFSSATINWNGMGLVQNGSGNGTIAGTAPTLGSYTRNSTAAKADAFVLSAASLTCTGGFTAAGSTVTSRVLVQTSAVGTQRTITAASATLTNVDFMDITGAGAATWSGTSIGDSQGNGNISFDASVTQTRTGAGGAWSTAGNWTSRVPLPQDDVVIGAGASGTITGDMPRAGRSIDYTGFTGTLTNSVIATTYGNLTLASGMTVTNSSVNFAGRGSQTITTNGKSMNSTISFAAAGGTYTLQDSLAMLAAGNFTVNSGTVDANGFNVSIASNFNFAGGTLFMRSGTFTTTTAVAGTPWTASGTINAGTSTIVLNNGGGANAQTFSGGGKTYYNLAIQGGGSTMTIAGSSTFNGVSIVPGRTVAGTAGTTQTVASGANFSATGTAASPITLQSSSAGTQWTLSVPSGTVSCDYLVLQDSKATGGATFLAGSHSSNVSGNTGWSPGFVQGNTAFAAGSGGAQAVAYAANVQAGDLLIASGGWQSVASASFAVTDTMGNNWRTLDVVVDATQGATVGVAIAIARATGPNTVTVTPGGTATFRRVWIQEYTGVNAVDQHAHATGNAATLNSGTVTTGYPNEVVWGLGNSVNGTAAAGAGYTLRQTASSESTEDQVLEAPGPIAVTFPDAAGGSQYICIIATFFNQPRPTPISLPSQAVARAASW